MSMALICFLVIAASPQDVVARIGDQLILESQITQLAGTYLQELSKLRQTLESRIPPGDPQQQWLMMQSIDAHLAQRRFEILYRTTRHFVQTQLIELAAKRRGKTAQELVNQQQSENELQQLMASLWRDERVQILIQPPVYPVNDTESPRLGTSDAATRVVTFVSVSCPDCRKLIAELFATYGQYPNKLEIVFRLVDGLQSSEPQPASVTALCALKNSDSTYLLQDIADSDEYSEVAVRRIAHDFGIGEPLLDACTHDSSVAVALRKNAEAAAQAGLMKLPGVYVNGVAMPFQYSVDEKIAAITRKISR